MSGEAIMCPKQFSHLGQVPAAQGTEKLPEAGSAVITPLPSADLSPGGSSGSCKRLLHIYYLYFRILTLGHG